MINRSVSDLSQGLINSKEKSLILDYKNYSVHLLITFLDKEQPAIYEEDRSLIYDVYCKTTDGDHIIVEMQNKEQPFFKKQSIYYVSEAISRQGERGAQWK